MYPHPRQVAVTDQFEVLVECDEWVLVRSDDQSQTTCNSWQQDVIKGTAEDAREGVTVDVIEGAAEDATKGAAYDCLCWFVLFLYMFGTLLWSAGLIYLCVVDHLQRNLDSVEDRKHEKADYYDLIPEILDEELDWLYSDFGVKCNDQWNIIGQSFYPTPISRLLIENHDLREARGYSSAKIHYNIHTFCVLMLQRLRQLSGTQVRNFKVKE